MSQLLLNIKDDSKTKILLQFLKSLNYISVEKLSKNDIIVPKEEKNIMRKRINQAQSKDFKNWDDIKDTF